MSRYDTKPQYLNFLILSGATFTSFPHLKQRDLRSFNEKLLRLKTDFIETTQW